MSFPYAHMEGHDVYIYEAGSSLHESTPLIVTCSFYGRQMRGEQYS